MVLHCSFYFDVALNSSQNFAGRIMLMSGDTGNCKNRKIKRSFIVTQEVEKSSINSANTTLSH